jgi:type IV secretory pathway VirD2 relaxase
MSNRGNYDDKLDVFRPRIGRPDRARDRVASSSVRVATLVRQGHGRLGGKGAARLPPTAGFGPRQNARRVVVKAHVQKLGGHGAQAAARHLRYIERDGVEKDGSPGVLYGPEGPAARETFEQPRVGERHQFRFIVSPEDAQDLDLTVYVRDLMKRVESDLGRSVEWAAVNHFDTDHPHAHVIVRGVCREGRQLRMDRAYIARGLRWSAQELATERLGPRLEVEIRRTREREVHQERFTSLDRAIEHAATERRVDAESLVAQRNGPEPALLVRRLKQLEGLGLAAKVAPSSWVLADDWQRSLRELGERGDILKQMHRALHGGDAERFHVVRPGQALPDGRGDASEQTLVGRVVRKGLGDEVNGRTFYAVVETPTGDAYHVTVGARVADAVRVGDLVSLGTQREPAVQQVDRHLAEVAAAQRGVYELAGNADGQNARFAARRLRELERIGVVTSQSPGQWVVPPDLLAQLETRHRQAPARYRLSLEAVPLGLDAQVGHRGPVWLDTVDMARVAAKGFGADVLAALERRRQVLLELGIAPADPQRDAKVSDREGRTVGREMAPSSGDGSGRTAGAEEFADRRALGRRAAGEAFAREHRMTFLENVPERFAGRVQAGPEGSGYLAVSDGARFVLVPAARESRVLVGTTVEVTRDAHGRFVGLRPRGLDLER